MGCEREGCACGSATQSCYAAFDPAIPALAAAARLFAPSRDTLGRAIARARALDEKRQQGGGGVVERLHRPSRRAPSGAAPPCPVAGWSGPPSRESCETRDGEEDPATARTRTGSSVAVEGALDTARTEASDIVSAVSSKVLTDGGAKVVTIAPGPFAVAAPPDEPLPGSGPCPVCELPYQHSRALPCAKPGCCT